MPYDPDTHHRRSIRLPMYDYSRPGAYFVTICTYHRELLFEDGALKQILEETWKALPERFPDISPDEFIIMPNHIHFIVWLNAVEAPLAGAHDAGIGVGAGASPAPTLASIVGAYKSIVSNQWLKWITANTPDRSALVWQRNYYERVVRDEDELARARQYIMDNPAKWAEDENNPAKWKVEWT